MPGTNPSAASRYRPAILVLIGAAAAYTGYLLYKVVQDRPSEGLHRSNAIRRARPRTRRMRTSQILQRLQQSTQPLGEFDFFGNSIVLDARNLISIAELREIAQEAQPGANPELVETLIAQLYDTFLDRLLALTFPNAPLSVPERDAVTTWLSPLVPEQTAIFQALQRHSARFAGGDINAFLNNDDGAESIAATDVSFRSWPYDDSGDDSLDADGQTLQRTLYHIAEDRARQEGVIHRGITCNACDTKPIRGIRWRCANCVDYDLCSDCEATNSHTKTHIFYKIRVPAPYLGIPKQEAVYPGRPHAMNPSISPSIKKRLLSETKMEGEEIEALWDQFTCLAGSEWESDPNNIGWALDRRAFNHAFVPRYSTFISAPNLIYDRIFAYYDTDHNGMIGFEEFVKGLDGMHSRDPKVKLKIVFNGYDVDGDGYISRRDVLRIFRAYYAIEKEATRNFLAEASEELSVRGALETIHSSQPLGSAFTQNSIGTRAATNPHLDAKPSDDSGDLRPVYDDVEDTADRDEILRITDPRRAIASLQEGDIGDEAVRERWLRRQFYIDEEEGFARPDVVVETSSTQEGQVDGVVGDPSATEQERPRGSRSSSRVRFQDDVDVETRSNASTSSRPVGERWGGYEIPEPEKDLGKEVLYQITQQAFNELLNPLFQEKEDNAIDFFNTRAERRKLESQILEATEEFKREQDMNKAAVYLGIFRYSKWLMNFIANSTDAVKVFLEDLKGSKLGLLDIQDRLATIFLAAEKEALGSEEIKAWTNRWEPDAMELWNAKLCRMQIRHDLTEAILGLARDLGWLPSSPAPTAPPSPGVPVSAPNFSFSRDPTMPQFRPNSITDPRTDTTAHLPQDVPAEALPATASSLNDYDIEYTRLSDPERHFFVLQGSNSDFSSSDTGSRSSASASHAVLNANTVVDAVVATENVLGAATSLATPLHSPPSAPQPPASETNNERAIFILGIDDETLSLHYETRVMIDSPPFDKDTHYHPVEREIRRAALRPGSPLHVAMLASLRTVEDEINDRNGSGLLSFAEFEEKMAEGRLRFLEAWMDWIRALASGWKFDSPPRSYVDSASSAATSTSMDMELGPLRTETLTDLLQSAVARRFEVPGKA